MGSPRLQVSVHPARLSSKGGNIWRKAIYTHPESLGVKRRSFCSVYGRTKEEAESNAKRMVSVMNAVKNLNKPAFWIECAALTWTEISDFIMSREDVKPGQSMTKRLIELARERDEMLALLKEMHETPGYDSFYQQRHILLLKIK